jgi:transmembrane sensor
MKKLKTQNRDRLEQETTEWLVRLTSGEATPADFADFAQWQQRSPAHQHAYQKIAALWEGLEKPLLAWNQQQNPLAIQAEAIENSDNLNEEYADHKASAENVWLKPLSMAALLVIIMAFSLFPDYLHHPLADYRTRIGEQTSVTLPDGSIIHLNTDTAININYTLQARNVEILQGEAEFEVAHDKQKPFNVTSGAVKTQAIGTKFLVRYDNDQGLVTLLEGKVRTAAGISDSGHTPTQITLTAGEQAEFNGNNLIAAKQADGAGSDSWKHGRLLMNFVTLEHAISEINRYRRGTVKLIDSSLAQREINAAIDLKHIDNWLDALETTLPLKVQHFGPITLIRSTS